MLILQSCSTTERLRQIGKLPSLSNVNIDEERNKSNIKSIPSKNPSLWHENSVSFLESQPLKKIGDIIKINVKLSDDAKLANASQRQRKTSENLTIPRLFGLQKEIKRTFSGETDKPENLASMSGSNSNLGKGQIDRSEKINMQVAAIVAKILSNGNLYLEGTQEIRVNYEVREVFITGIVRPEDINSDNSIESSKIAELRISYGGRGHVSDMQQPRLGIQLIDVLSPF